MRRICVALVVSLALAACGGGSRAGGRSETADLAVRVTAEQVMGCTQSTQAGGFDIGNDRRLVVEDQDGSTVGVGTFQLSPGLTEGVDICDWTAVARVTKAAEFYRLVVGAPMVEVSRAELERRDWQLYAHIEIDGSVTVNG